MSINSLETPIGDILYYDKGFTTHLESYIPYLREASDNQFLAVDQHDAYKYEGDLFGLFDSMGIPRELHWVVMRLNNLSNVISYDVTIPTMVVPSDKKIRLIAQKFRALIDK